MKREPTREDILRLFDYDREEGVLFSRRSSARKAAGGVESGKVVISLPGKNRHYRGVLIWLLETGEYRENIIHKDDNSLNDRFSNLYALPMTPAHLTVSDILNAFHYDRQTGDLRRVYSHFRSRAGSLGWKTNKGYLIHSLLGKKMTAHSMVWFIETGKWPEDEIDHINGVKYDNRIENLRVVSTRGNCTNRPLRSDNTTGVNGVSYRPGRRLPYIPTLGVMGKHLSLGAYGTLEEAVEARRKAEADHPFHPNHGKTSEERAKTT